MKKIFESDLDSLSLEEEDLLFEKLAKELGLELFKLGAIKKEVAFLLSLDQMRYFEAIIIKKEEKTSVVKTDSKVLLFTTKTCPNCSMIKKVLRDKQIDYELIDAEENVELSKKYNIVAVPTLVTQDGIYVNASSIIGYIQK